MGFKMKGFPMMSGTSAMKQAYEETRRVKRTRRKSREADMDVERLKRTISRLEENFKDNMNPRREDRLADLRAQLIKAETNAAKRAEKYEKSKKYIDGEPAVEEVEEVVEKVDTEAADADVDPIDPTAEQSVDDFLNSLLEEGGGEETEGTGEEVEEEVEEESDDLADARAAIEAQQRRNERQGGTKNDGGTKTTYIKHGDHDTRPAYNL